MAKDAFISFGSMISQSTQNCFQSSLGSELSMNDFKDFQSHLTWILSSKQKTCNCGMTISSHD